MSTYEELQAELAGLRAEMREMRAQLQPVPTAGQQDSRTALMSRRNLLRAAPIAAIGAGIVAMAATPAAASTGNPVLQGVVNDDGSGTTTLNGGHPVPPGATGTDVGLPPALAVVGGVTSDWLAVQGLEVGGDQGALLHVVARDLQGLAASFSGGPQEINHGEEGVSAVAMDCVGPGTVLTVALTDGFFDDPSTPAGGVAIPGVGIAVTGESGTAIDATANGNVVAVHSNGQSTQDAVTIDYDGKGRAFLAQSTSTANINGTVTGVNAGVGIGVWGENKNTTAAGIGVVGVGNAKGRGGRFAGGVANVQLTPGKTSSHPSFTGHVGDLFVDSTGRLWYCQKTNTSSVAATWKQLA